MAEKTEFELVSPEKLLVSQPVDMVVVPGSEGDFGVLPGHSPVIATLRPGVIAVYEGDRVVDRMFVAGGFAEVTETRCTVLAEEACPIDALDRTVIDSDIRDLEGEIAGTTDDAARRSLEARLVVARAK